MLRPISPAFTLVELLVVVAIIVILLAIAVPAFDRAIRQANLARCATNLRAIAQGATLYAMGSNRYYPQREAVKTDWGFVTIIARDAGNPGGPLDDRPRLSSHIPLDALVDPLCGDISMTDTQKANGVASMNYIGVGGTQTGTEVLLCNYALMFSMPFLAKNNASMNRMADRLRIDGHNFSVIAADYDVTSKQAWNGRWTASSHADADGRTQFQRIYNQGNLMWSEWARINTDNVFPAVPRGTCDFNYAYKDNSVRRITRVAWDDSDEAKIIAPMMNRLPRNFNNWNNDKNVDYMQLPHEDDN